MSNKFLVVILYTGLKISVMPDVVRAGIGITVNLFRGYFPCDFHSITDKYNLPQVSKSGSYVFCLNIDVCKEF